MIISGVRHPRRSAILMLCGSSAHCGEPLATVDSGRRGQERLCGRIEGQRVAIFRWQLLRRYSRGLALFLVVSGATFSASISLDTSSAQTALVPEADVGVNRSRRQMLGVNPRPGPGQAALKPPARATSGASVC
jgi:hypothetical protein